MTGASAHRAKTGEVAVLRPDPVMFLGYFEDEEATARKFIGDWMTTGDQCVMDADGYYHFVGRDDDIINSAGYRVGPGEIEDCAVSHPPSSLPPPSASPMRCARRSSSSMSCLQMACEGSEALQEEIRRHVKARMAANIYPREMEFVAEIPLTTTGKVIRRIFRDRCPAGGGGGVAASPAK